MTAASVDRGISGFLENWFVVSVLERDLEHNKPIPAFPAPDTSTLIMLPTYPFPVFKPLSYPPDVVRDACRSGMQGSSGACERVLLLNFTTSSSVHLRAVEEHMFKTSEVFGYTFHSPG